MAVKADITIDIDKQVGELQNLTQIYNARVGDNKTPLTIAWRKNDLPLNLKGLHAYIVGKTGDGSYNSETGKIDFPVNTPVSQFEDDGSGTLDGGQSGLTTLLIPKQMWQNSGLFAGYIGLKSEDGSVFTSKDIWFKVLGNVLDAGVQINYFIGDFDKALSEAEKKLQDKTDSFDQVTAKALQDLHDKYLQKAQHAEDTLSDTNAAIDANLASLKKIAASIGNLQAQLDADNLETMPQHNADILELNKKFDNQISQIHLSPERFSTLDDVRKQYPTGSHNLITTDDGYTAIWQNGAWQRGNIYQSVGIPDKSIDSSKLSNLSTDWKPSYDQPIILDWNNKTLTIPDGSAIMMHSKTSNIELSYGTFKWDDKLPYVFVSVTSDAKTIKFYSGFDSIPNEEIFIGWIMVNERQYKFDFRVIETEQQSADKDPSTAIYIDEKHLPSIRTNMVTSSKIFVDYDKASLILTGDLAFAYKKKYIYIYSGQYDLHDEDGKIHNGWIYLFYDTETSNYTIKLFKNQFDNRVENLPCIGYVMFDSKNFYLLDYGQSFNKNDKHFVIVKGEKVQVDFEKNEVIFPKINHLYIPYYMDLTTSSFAIPIKYTDGTPNDNGNVGYFFGIDPAKLTSNSASLKDAIVVAYSLRTLDNCLYLGWVETNAKTYNFGQLGSSFTKNKFDQKLNKPFYQKAITCLGDSITAGDSGEGSIIDSYVPRMASLLGTTPTNAGVCGSTITKADDRKDSFVERIGNIKNQDVVTIFGGTNDFFLNRNLGQFNDDSDNPVTFYAALKYLVLHLSAQNPSAKLLIMTPARSSREGWAKYDADGNLIKNKAGYTVDDYCNAIRKVAEYYAIPVLDLQKMGNYNPCIPSQRGHDALSADGLHPTAKGYDRLALTIAHSINSL